jgi:hypothetical protein
MKIGVDDLLVREGVGRLHQEINGAWPAPDDPQKLFCKFLRELARTLPPELTDEVARQLVAKGLSKTDSAPLLAEVKKFNPPLARAAEAELKTWQREHGPAVEILDELPPAIIRPLGIVNGVGYLCTVVPVSQDGHSGQKRIVLRSDGKIFAEAQIPGSLPLDELELELRIREMPDPARMCSGRAVREFAAGRRANPRDVFQRVTSVVDHFIDFADSLGGQAEMCELVALFVLAGYFLDAFNVIGYLWATGAKGSGKSTLLLVVARLSFLGEFILSSSGFPALRDLADNGATLAFDDAEAMAANNRQTDPNKRELFLAGTRRGTTLTIKEKVGDGEWVTRRINAFCPRLFSAIGLPDPILGSRAIPIPQVTTVDAPKSHRSPMDDKAWPVNRQELIDDLFLIALEHLPAVQRVDEAISARVGDSLVGRELEPWRALLSLALWLQEQHGLPAIFDTMLTLAMKHQREKDEIVTNDVTALLIRALLAFAQREKPPRPTFTVRTEDVLEEVRSIGAAESSDVDLEKVSTRTLGRNISQLRLGKSVRTDANKKRGYAIQLHSLLDRARTSRVDVDPALAALVAPRAGATVHQADTTHCAGGTGGVVAQAQTTAADSGSAATEAPRAVCAIRAITAISLEETPKNSKTPEVVQQAGPAAPRNVEQPSGTTETVGNNMEWN